MREIKFRVWNERYKEMRHWGFIDDGMFTGIPTGAGLTLEDCAKSMQFTGLKDKNGMPIYEGDILGIEGATAKVVFWERPPEFGLDYYHNEDKWCEDWNLTYDSERMEIIGNIYENENLLSDG